MAKKQPEERVEFVKFIKKLYTDDVQLNFDEYFILDVIDKEVYLIFPEDKFYRLYGKLDIKDADNFKDWLTETNCSVKIYNKDLDALRKLKLGYFLSIDKNDNEYKINLDPEAELEFSMVKEEPIKLHIDHEYSYEMEIPKEYITDRSTLLIGLKDNTESIYENTFESENIIFDSPTKNFKFIFKKDAKYSFHSTEKDSDGFRIIMLEGKGNYCTLRQYFKVI